MKINLALEVSGGFMQVACQHKVGDNNQLVLLDLEHTTRRLLVEAVTWQAPVWTPDGRCIQFEQFVSVGNFVMREITLDSGEVRDLPPVVIPPLPDFYDFYKPSPGGRWCLYRSTGNAGEGCFCIAGMNGVKALELRFPFTSVVSWVDWSPCGSRLSLDLTAGEQSGIYVVSLLEGTAQRVSPVVEVGHFYPNGWSPDGAWVQATKTHWHNPKTYDYEWLELWLLKADGSAAQRLTEDGQCFHPAVRPAGARVQNLEHKLSFDWEVLRLEG